MLEINGIVKTYELKDSKVDALKGVTMRFRRSEFVSILGPSGCGKTTLLNVIGGLDRYNDGDLVIDGVSTKDYKDKDWDNYRNHRVGFVFQSYNLIPHQTVLENVELALTLSGIKKSERRARAVEVLNRVGLGDKLKSKPNQLSGGQMQRVAIARALVNNPEIILADEPTGALDSKTSVQIMDLLKQVSKDRLVIMVTHNPELAEQYSSRIIKLLDGELIEDSKPYSKEECDKDTIKRNKAKEKAKQQSSEQEGEKKKNKVKKEKTSMSFFTALFLSLKNILTKKARTILIAVAGSIGIIGIGLVLSISSGFSTYINRMQEDTLSTYPLTIQEKSIDFSDIIHSMFMGGSNDGDVDHDKDAVYPKDTMGSIINSVGKSLKANNLNAFYKYINKNYNEIKDDVTAIKYTYNLDLEFYTYSETPSPVQPNSDAVKTMITKYSLYYFQNQTHVDIVETTGGYQISKIDGVEPDYTFIRGYNDLAYIETMLESEGSFELNEKQVIGLTFSLLGLNPSSLGSGSGSNMMSMFGMSGNDIFYEMLDNQKLIREQYSLVGANSKFPQGKNEALLVLDKNNEVDEYVLYALGILSDDDMDKMLKELVLGNKLKLKIDFDSIIGKTYKVLDESDYFRVVDGELTDIRDFKETDVSKYNQLYDTALSECTNTVKITGIVRAKDSVDAGSLSTGVAYLKDFTQTMIDYHNESSVVEDGKMSAIALDTPASISFYVKSFESKKVVKNFIETYNKQAKQGDEITYTDTIDLIMSTVSTIINAITYVLIAFVSVSLIVSSIMIGIITYISVIERTKEIGVLRSIGASKRDVKRVFTAETFIIGLTSGVFGILVALLFTLPINIVLKSFTGIGGLASLPFIPAICLILISVALTFIAGLIPARIASKKDPVLALRSE